MSVPYISLIQGLSPGLCVNESPVRFHACTTTSSAHTSDPQARQQGHLSPPSSHMLIRTCQLRVFQHSLSIMR